MNQNLEIVRAAVIKAVPEILELKFGCVLLDTRFPDSLWTYVGLRNDKTIMLWRDKSGYGFGKKEEFEILGRPIRLADCIQAMSVRYKNVFPNSVHKVDEELLIPLVEMWNLLDDDLNKNPQCWDFLSELLK